MYIPSSIVGVYLIIGLLVALAKHYLTHLGTAARLGDALVAILLWPAIIFGSSNFHHFFH